MPMNFTTISLFVIGIGTWVVATDTGQISNYFSSISDPASESISDIKYSEKSDVDISNIKSKNAEHSTDDKSEPAASYEHDTSNDSNENTSDDAILLAENTTPEETTDKSSASKSESKKSTSSENAPVGHTTEANPEQKANTTDAMTAEVSEKPESANSDSSLQKPAQPAMPTMNPHMNNNMWMTSMQNPMNYYNWMNPMFYMMGPMMSMMGSMMNPAIYMNPMMTMNYPITAMTQEQNLDAMMRAMDPRLMFGMFGHPSASYLEGEVPDQLPVVTIPGFPTQLYQNWPKNMPSESISREAKMNAFQTAMAMSPLSMRNMVSMMADKIPVAEDVSWDDAVEAMKLRANEVNFKFVGSSPLWKQIEAETEQPSTKVEIFRFCDARVARKILDEVPEFIVFLPCRIALLEDADGKLWVMTLDWDVSWLDYAQNPNTHLPKDLREDATRVRESIAYIMEGAATGDF